MADLNGVMMQYFHWYTPEGGVLWDEVCRNAAQLAEAGFTALWLPPAYKQAIAPSPAYDLFDLGTSDATAALPTKYGTRQQYLDAIKAVQTAGLQVYADVPLDRASFNLDLEDNTGRGELTRWGKWYLNTTGVDGFCLDMGDRLPAWFVSQWLDDLEHHAGRNLFAMGAYWYDDINALHSYLDAVGVSLSAFDVPLHYNLHRASRAGGDYDMRRILHGTLMRQRPVHAVTFVENHDSQPLRSLESVVEPWFKPLAYATILLRREGYPCVFYADYYGAEYEDSGSDGKEYWVSMLSHRWLIDKFLYARKHFAYGPQYDYFDHWDTIGWTRLGDAAHPQGLAVLMSDGPEGYKWMQVGKPNTRFIDLTEHIQEPIDTNEWGWGEFRCRGGSVSVWVQG